ncbi:MAG: RsmB/NOP family class I SAM-dependent RNA methyltransferase, partial [Aestuariivirgaceae bacterium]|nr:RsmB/NOP family class I SAM-dependent RNA methyltransferase [Aestuariivirgaceae bacterium]
ALRRKGHIDELLKKYLTKPLPLSAGFTLEIIMIAAAQILFMRVPPHAASSLAVETALADQKARHFTGLINAVLRRLADDAPAILAVKPKPGINVPRWLFARWQRHYATPTAREIAKAHLEEAALDLTVKADAELWAERLGAELLPGGTLRLATSEGRIDELPGYAQGAWWVQDQAASLPAKLLGDVAGLRVLDLCAAPGGKTAQLAAAGAKVTAVDISARRLDRLKANLQRLDLQAEIINADVLAFTTDEPFDAILLDAPCSASGTLRRHPDIAWHRSEAQIRELVQLQRAMQRHAVNLLKPGGRLVFSTCSLEPDEGEEHLEFTPPGLILDPIAADELPDSRLLAEPGILRSLPQFGMDGFFAARYVRV